MKPSAQYMPGLTGLRGIAVVAVVAYHLGLLRGGFLGVDVFFALSGFLITGLLLKSPPSLPRGLGKWWMKRFRRLTPAVAIVVIAVLIAFATRSGVVMNSIATLTWWQNWHLILEGKPYWASSPSALRHAWSLSIEEQFYAFWPLLLLTTLAAAKRLRLRHPRRLVAGVALAIATASFALSFTMAISGGMSLTRIYYGTDTRIGGLLLGCATAAITAEFHLLRTRRFARLASGPAVIGLLALMVLITPESRFTYTGGLLLATVLSLLLVVASSRPGTLTTILSRAPLQWLGIHSYAIYLWSWPVQVFIEDRSPSTPRFVVVAITALSALVLSAISLRLVEDPLRRATLWASKVRPRRAAWFGGYAILAVLMLVAANSTQATSTEKLAKQFERLPDPTTTSTTICVPPSTSSTTVPEFIGGDVPFDDSTVTKGGDPTRDPCADDTISLMVVGDSTARGAANGLKRLKDPKLLIWDRSELGCNLKAANDTCPDWRQKWTQDVKDVNPNAVLAYMMVSDDLIPGDDPPFMSAEGIALRRSELTEATRILGAGGAQVIWALPPHMGKQGEFYCNMATTESVCDPVWIDQWRADLTLVASAQGAETIDIAEWIATRPVETFESDRPDGLHFAGVALDAHAGWLAQAIRSQISSGG